MNVSNSMGNSRANLKGMKCHQLERKTHGITIVHVFTLISITLDYITFVIFNALEYKGNTNFRTTKYLRSGSLLSGQGYLVSTIQEHHLPVYLLLLLLLWQLPLLHMEGNVPAQHDLLKTLYSYEELLFSLYWNNDHSLH